MVNWSTRKAMLRDRFASQCRGIPKFLCKVLTIKSVVSAIVALSVFYFVISYLHTITYIWQCTTLANGLRPVARTSCPVLSPGGALQVTETKPGKVGLLMIYNDNYGGADKKLVPRLIENRKRYCDMHGCTVISSPTKKSDRPPAWEKLTSMLDALNTNLYDYIFYVDMDMVIMNPEKSPWSFIAQAPPKQDFILTNDWSGVNTGVILARNSQFTKWFLQTAYDQEQLVDKYSATGIAHPFEYEQRAFHFLLNTPLWQARELPKYRGNSTELSKHFTSLPQCSMNSYVLHPLEFRANREESQYVESDFIVHLAGKKGQIKIDLMNYYLDLAEDEYK